MNLDEYIALLKGYQERPPEVVIALSEPSAGPSAVCSIYPGGDWDHGRMFIVPTERLIRAASVTYEDVRAPGGLCVLAVRGCPSGSRPAVPRSILCLDP